MTRRAFAALAILLSLPGAAYAATETFVATMNGKDEVPPKTTSGTGTVKATLDTSTKVLTWDGTYSGLTGPATMAHFHGPAAAGSNAGVMVPWKDATSSPVHGTATLTDAQIADLETGKWYANVHNCYQSRRRNSWADDEAVASRRPGQEIPRGGVLQLRPEERIVPCGEPALCLYSVTNGQQAIRELYRAMIDRTGNMPPLPGIFPDNAAPIVRVGLTSGNW